MNAPKTCDNVAKPILKWAGGKNQLIKDLLPFIPQKYNRYIEPFFGGGALFFYLRPDNAIISDSNPELINVYNQVANNLDSVIEELQQLENTKEMFYEVRSRDWVKLKKEEAAARTIYLNKTCFNGLYRVNRQGQFNTPYGNYKKPNYLDIENLTLASDLLKKATIICEDYQTLLRRTALNGDFVFLDPPYLPVSEYSDFKRYTKDQFYEEDHRNLAKTIELLHDRGCYVILTNSNHPLVHELFSDFDINVIQTRRHISCRGDSRIGEDVIVNIPPSSNQIVKSNDELSDQILKYPSTRFMGSKSKMIKDIWDVCSQYSFESVIDLFSGSGIVGYMFKSQGKAVISNDYMAMSAVFSKAMIENNNTTLTENEVLELFKEENEIDNFVSKTFKDLYFTDDENHLIDVLRCNIKKIKDEYKQSIAMAALIRACMKKRPRGIFTYTGQRYDDGRADLQKTLKQHFLDAVELINNAIFNNNQINKSICGDAMQLSNIKADLVYIDPPYYSPLSDNEYVRRYHFVEGLARNWEGVTIQEHTKTKKFKSYPTPFSTKNGARDAFDKLFSNHSDSIIVVSYSSNSLPSQEEMIELIKKYKEHVDVIPVQYQYSFGNQGDAKTHRNSVQEFLFVGH